jgi:hypothetical protein
LLAGGSRGWWGRRRAYGPGRGSLTDHRNIVQAREDGAEPPVSPQAFVNLNPLASFACQGGNPPPRRKQGSAHAGQSGEGGPGTPGIGRCMRRTAAGYATAGRQSGSQRACQQSLRANPPCSTFQAAAGLIRRAISSPRSPSTRQDRAGSATLARTNLNMTCLCNVPCD